MLLVAHGLDRLDGHGPEGRRKPRHYAKRYYQGQHAKRGAKRDLESEDVARVRDRDLLKDRQQTDAGANADPNVYEADFKDADDNKK